MLEAAAAQCIEVERCVLGTMFSAPSCIAEAAKLLRGAHFFRDAHHRVFDAIVQVHSEGVSPDLVSVVAELTRRGQIDACGGPYEIAGLLESPGVPQNLPHYARAVREAWAERERTRIGLQLANGSASDAEVSRKLIETLDRIQSESIGENDPAKKWASLALTGSELVAADLPALPSWIGDGLLPSGELAFLTGHSGVGKTFLTVQLMSALSIGHTFNGLSTQACNVGLIELEMPWASIQRRVSALHSGDLSRMAFMCSPPGAVHVQEASVRDGIVAFCVKHALDVLIFDPFNRLHDADENSGSDMGHVLEGLHDIRRRTNVAMVVLHHVRKQPAVAGGPAANRSASLDSGRGSSRLTNDPATVMVLDETKGLIRLTFAKVRHAESPQPIYMKRNDRGFFDVSTDPMLETVRRRDQLTEMLHKAGPDGITAELAAEVLKVGVRTIQRDLGKIGAVMTRHGKHDKRWTLGEESGGFND